MLDRYIHTEDGLTEIVKFHATPSVGEEVRMFVDRESLNVEFVLLCTENMT